MPLLLPSLPEPGRRSPDVDIENPQLSGIFSLSDLTVNVPTPEGGNLDPEIDTSLSFTTRSALTRHRLEPRRFRITRRGEAGGVERGRAPRHGPGVEPVDCQDVPPPRAGRGAVPGKADLMPSVLDDAPGVAGAADGQTSLLLEEVPDSGRPPLAPWGHRGEGNRNFEFGRLGLLRGEALAGRLDR